MPNQVMACLPHCEIRTMGSAAWRPQYWLDLLGLALTVLVAMELHKAVR